MRSLILVRDESIALQVILGLPALVRTLRALRANGVDDISIVGPQLLAVQEALSNESYNSELKFLKTIPNSSGSLSLSAEVHYDPHLIKEVVQRSVEDVDGMLGNLNPLWWERLDAKQGAKRAAKKLFQVIHNNTEGWAAKFVNKPISFLITRFLVKTSVTPNQITFVTLLISLTGAFFLANTSYVYRVLGVSLIYLGSILDGCDGEVARLKIMSSNWGGWFDTIADDLSTHTMVIALFLGIYRITGETLYLYFGGVTLFSSIAVSFMIYHHLLHTSGTTNAADFKPVWQEDKTKKGNWYEWLRPFMKRDFFLAVVLVLTVLSQSPLLGWITFCVTTVTFLVHLSSFLIQKFGDPRGE